MVESGSVGGAFAGVGGSESVCLREGAKGHILKEIDPVGLDPLVGGTDTQGNVEESKGPTSGPKHASDNRVGSFYYGTWREIKLSATDILARHVAKPICGAVSGLCNMVARSKVSDPANQWKERLFNEYARGGTPDRVFRLSVAESKDWIARANVSPIQAEAFNDVFNQQLIEAKKDPGHDVNFKFHGTGFAEFSGPGGFAVEWDISVTIHAGNRRATYTGTAKLTDYYDFDPAPLRQNSPKRTDENEFLTRAGQALQGSPYKIESPELTISGEGLGLPSVAGEASSSGQKEEKH